MVDPKDVEQAEKTATGIVGSALRYVAANAWTWVIIAFFFGWFLRGCMS